MTRVIRPAFFDGSKCSKGADELGAKRIQVQYDVTITANFRGISSSSKTPSTPNSQTQSSRMSSAKSVGGKKNKANIWGAWKDVEETQGRAWGKDPHPRLQLSRFRSPPLLPGPVGTVRDAAAPRDGVTACTAGRKGVSLQVESANYLPSQNWETGRAISVSSLEPWVPGQHPDSPCGSETPAKTPS